MDEFKWNGENNHMFSLHILNYKSPEKQSEGNGAEWLKIRVEASNGMSSWTKTDSCLLTWELVWLREWLYNVVDGNVKKNEMSFLEPELKFIFLATTRGWHHFSVILQYGLARSSEHQPNVLHLQLSERDYISSLELLDKAINVYPSRTTRGKNNEKLGLQSL